ACRDAGSRASWSGRGGQHARRRQHLHTPPAHRGRQLRRRLSLAVTHRLRTHDPDPQGTGTPSAEWGQGAPGDGRMKKILIVEDEEGMLDGLAHNFRYEGYDVVTAKNGQEGLRIALKQKPDAVLLDIMLPEKDGFTVLKELRQRHKEIPVLVMTARNFEADVLKGFDLGADDYVTKPFSVKEVMARVKRLVARGPMNTGAPATTTYTFGDVEVRFEPREVHKQ